jgi:glutathione S-transferase
VYLADKYGKLPAALEAKSTIIQWILFANATLGPGIFVEANREREMPKLMMPLNQILEKQPFLLGDELSVADVAVGAILAYIPMMLNLDLSEYPAIVDYIKRLSERPAFQKGIGARR